VLAVRVKVVVVAQAGFKGTQVPIPLLRLVLLSLQLVVVAVEWSFPLITPIILIWTVAMVVRAVVQEAITIQAERLAGEQAHQGKEIMAVRVV
jgi:hypothetical protein